ncbi:uncharacterized protein L969DRAFT_50098 [Mixia osmundae IAM 14324]|uniref:Uncharacterized protein n=1 Tax=Mixia osmundae (strain CBS 9802 / IAM 14324 / JCM 22182 / KY 12970) TaxID=764103 RepID=G7E0Y9_MIXOS|nr:uncharacterized protein L969DRAFT_50098 [Mixia osmundae IAM 14324]KEI38866.1 hypothetical protein L969DRAFT_50098 [Mixia osmundae IAM 14324]GAA96499.1 hypothetical protein E5Q_03167 [Mixia osmundae IAM 14324]
MRVLAVKSGSHSANQAVTDYQSPSLISVYPTSISPGQLTDTSLWLFAIRLLLNLRGLVGIFTARENCCLAPLPSPV